jgi:hypothetical protein
LADPIPEPGSHHTETPFQPRSIWLPKTAGVRQLTCRISAGVSLQIFRRQCSHLAGDQPRVRIRISGNSNRSLGQRSKGRFLSISPALTG